MACFAVFAFVVVHVTSRSVLGTQNNIASAKQALSIDANGESHPADADDFISPEEGTSFEEA
jgi:hypothetical protein